MTSVRRVAAALVILFIDLAGRSVIDKVLALTGDASRVAVWAQLQSVVELVCAVSSAGVLAGLTVLVAQATSGFEERRLLRAALGLSILISGGLAILIVACARPASMGLGQSDMGPGLIALAAVAGALCVMPATLNAYWLGKSRQPQMLWLALLGALSVAVIAMAALAGAATEGLMTVQVAMLALGSGLVWRYLRRVTGRIPTAVARFAWPAVAAPAAEASVMSVASEARSGRALLRPLLRFIPVGLTIGVMSPASMLLMRAGLAESLSWHEVGHFQALWRLGDWVAALASGMLSLVFLPRLSARWGSDRFLLELRRAAVVVLAPAAGLLALLFLAQAWLLALLYDARFVVSEAAAAWFLGGSWVRIVSWVFLYGLFAAHRTRTIMLGEFLSLPLFAALLWLGRDGMTLERASMLYLVTYLVYAIVNAIGLALPGSRPAPVQSLPQS